MLISLVREQLLEYYIQLCLYYISCHLIRYYFLKYIIA